MSLWVRQGAMDPKIFEWLIFSHSTCPILALILNLILHDLHERLNSGKWSTAEYVFRTASESLSRSRTGRQVLELDDWF